jgi:hypothetical protein
LIRIFLEWIGNVLSWVIYKNSKTYILYTFQELYYAWLGLKVYTNAAFVRLNAMMDYQSYEDSWKPDQGFRRNTVNKMFNWNNSKSHNSAKNLRTRRGLRYALSHPIWLLSIIALVRSYTRWSAPLFSGAIFVAKHI